MHDILTPHLFILRIKWRFHFNPCSASYTEAFDFEQVCVFVQHQFLWHLALGNAFLEIAGIAAEGYSADDTPAVALEAGVWAAWDWY